MILYHRSLGRKGPGYRVWNTGWSWPDTVDHLDASLEMNACSNWRACEPWAGEPLRSKFGCGIGQRSGLLGVDFAVWPRMCWCRGTEWPTESRPRIHRQPFSARPGPLPHLLKPFLSSLFPLLDIRAVDEPGVGWDERWTARSGRLMLAKKLHN